MRWDKKLTFYLTLLYFIYALSNMLTLGDFVPPIPIFPFLIPFLALCFLVKSSVSIFSLLIFIISIGVPIHMFTFLNPLIIQWFSLLAILSLLVAGIIFLKHFYSNDNSIYSNYLFGIIMLLSPVLIIHNNYVLYTYFACLGLSSLICLKSNRMKKQRFLVEYRFILFIAFICSLYSINLLALLSFYFFK